MAYFKLITFGGIAPQVSPRLLQDQIGQTATNVNLDSGKLAPIYGYSNANDLTNASQDSIYKYTDSPERWLQFDEEGVDVVPGPIAGDTNNTVYWTGQSYPRMGRSDVILGSEPYPSSHYRLGIPAPTTAPTVALQAEASFDATVTTLINSGTITVTTATAHGASVGDYVTLAGFPTTDEIEATDINGDFKITAVPSTTTVEVKTSGSANAGNVTTASITDGATFKAQSDALADYSTSYVYTFVSAYGEEGPPSPASTVLSTDDNRVIELTDLETTSSKTNSNFGTASKKRIYRSNTGSNTTVFQFVGEVTMATTSFTDVSDNDQLGEIIPSYYWIGPPDDDTSTYPDGPLQGLTALPNGIFAGFTGKRICFSEPFLPHAWPVIYRITLEEEIVAIGAAGNGVIVTTKGRPYLITGTDPQSMSAIRIEAAQACLAKSSLVDMGPYVMYASPDGLVAAAGTDVTVVTEGIISPAQWQTSYFPGTIKGFLWEGRYLGFYTDGNGDTAGFIFDPRGGTNSFVELTESAAIRGGFTDPDDNNAYLIIQQKIKKFQGNTGTTRTLTFKTKEFVPPRPTSMGFVKVVAEDYPVTIKVYGDGNLYYNATISLSGVAGPAYSVTGSAPTSFSATLHPEPILRLPAKLHTDYEIEVIATATVNELCIGESIDELREI
jgi:hypothetical protein